MKHLFIHNETFFKNIYFIIYFELLWQINNES